MKKRRILGCMAALALTLQASAQFPDWNTQGNNILTTEWFGADGGSTIPLQIRHDANQPIEFFTNGVNRMRLLPSVPGQNINGYGGIDLTGNVGIGIFNPLSPGNLVSRPHSLLHLNGGGTQDSGYRPWMQTGITMTRQTDQSYFGLKDEGGARNHTVVAWSDNNLTHPGPDLLKFIFVADNVLANGIAGSDDGLEAVRVAPAGGGNESFFGIGDWFTTGGNGNPTERLDILDGHVRIRELPTTPDANTLNKYMVVDNNGVVKWRTLPASTGTDCDWELSPGNFTMNTAWRNAGTNGSCPDARWKLSIGSNSVPSYKLEVHHSSVVSAAGGGINVRFKGANGTAPNGVTSMVEPANASLFDGYAAFHSIRGVTNGGHGSYSRTVLDIAGATPAHAIGAAGIVQAKQGTTANAYGCSGRVSSESSGTIIRSYALKGVATGVAGSVTYNYGVHASADAGVGVHNYSVFGANPGAGVNDWSGYFAGRTYSPTMSWTASDGNLKTGIEPVTNATEKILGLHPKSYHFDLAAHPHMGLPEGVHYGFVAQELAEQFPEMVIETLHPAEVDSMGQEIHPAVPFKAVNTSGITPILVAAFQEQHQVAAAQLAGLDELRALVAEQAARLDALEAALNACCNNPDGSQIAPQVELQKADPRTERLLRIDPNPFTDQTTVRYTLERGGRVSLLVHGSAGQHIQVLHEAPMEQGEYGQVWRTNDLAPGTYYVTLLLDGEPLVKRAVKVQ